MHNIPRLLIAGTGGDCGKTLLALSLAAYWRSRDLAVAAYKKGPDFIDAAWLKWAAESPARNLDTYMMGFEVVKESFFVSSQGFDLAVIEGNRGLHDGFDSAGTHSSAELAKIIGAPVILIVNGTKVTRTAAAVVWGCMKLDPAVNITGVICNRVSGKRHREILRESIESICGIPVLGFIPPLEGKIALPSRHLGLVTPEEHPGIADLRDILREIVEDYLEISKIDQIAAKALPLEIRQKPENHRQKVESKVKIAYFEDSAFTFYYPENLEALETAGAELIPVSSLKDEGLTGAEGLFIGGGFPETHLPELSFNRKLRDAVKAAAKAGMPIYAECGGFIYLCETLEWGADEFELAGVLPLKLKMFEKPQGHGYCQVEVDGLNPFFPQGTVLKGHEFHYTGVISGSDKVKSVYAVKRGSGCFNRRDGIIYKNVLAGYLHLHALGTPQWAPGFVKAVRQRRLSGG